MVFSVLIRFYYSHSRLEEAVEAYNLSKKIVQIHGTLGKREGFFYYLFSSGVLHFELYDFHKANEYFLRAEAFLPDSDKEKARLYYNLSLINEKIHNDKTVCLYYSEKAYEFMKKTGEQNRTVNILLVRSIQFFSINQPEKALKCVEEAQSLVSLQDADPRLKSSIVYSFGRIYQMKKEYTEAIDYFNEYIQIVETLFPEKVLKGYKRLAEISIHQKEWDSVAVYLEKAQNVATKYKKVFFDKETKLLEITTYKIKQLDDKYEKEMQKLLSYCIEQQDDDLSQYLASELGVYYYERQAYKKAASYLKQAYDIGKNQKKDMTHILDGFRFEF